MPSLVSIETVTLVSDVDTKSTDTPFSANAWKAFARKPTSCHIPTVVIETRVMPLRMQIPLTCGSISSVTDEMTVPAISGDEVLRIKIGIPWSRAGEMQRGWSTELPAEASSCASS